jgi:RimJ/RimL family protein N-acetyltransferase
MTSINLRIASRKDFQTIIDLQKQDGFKHSYSLTKERLARLSKRGELFYIVESNNRPVGMISLDIEIRARLHFFSIHKDFQRKGIGTEILHKIISELKHSFEDVKVVFCYSEKNAPIVNFLKKNSFKEVGFYRNRFRNDRDAVILERELH